MKEKFKRIFIEVPTIVLSVIIALAINQWNSGREREQLAANVLMTIREELTSNTAQVQKAYEYHRPLVKNLMSGEHRMFSIPRKSLNMTKIDAQSLDNSLSELLMRFGEVVVGPLGVKKIYDSLFTFHFKQQLLTIRVTDDSLSVYGKGNISLHSALVRNNAWRIAQAAQIAPYLDFSLIALMSEVDQLHIEYEKTTGRIVEMLYQGGNDVTPAMQDMLYYETVLLKKYSELDSLLNY